MIEKRSKARPLLCVLILGSFFANQSCAGQYDLPDIGDGSTAALTETNADKLGREIYLHLQAEGLIHRDPVATPYLTNLVEQLSAVSTDQKVTPFWVNDTTVNAFATPGGYVGVHLGLLRGVDQESELAAVLAHELAHITQHHIARAFEKNESTSLPTAAALLAAVLIGAHDSQLGQAVLYSSLGSQAQVAINFTRDNEAEADAVGIRYLARAGFATTAMASAFKGLMDQTRFSGAGVPEFLRSHPVYANRIADALDLATQYPGGSDEKTGDFTFVRTYLAVKEVSLADQGELLQRIKASGDPIKLAGALAALVLRREMTAASEFAAGLDQSQFAQLESRRYRFVGLAILNMSLGENVKAEHFVDQALGIYPTDILFNKLKIDLNIRLGNTDVALRTIIGLMTYRAAEPVALELAEETYAQLGRDPLAAYYRAELLFADLQYEAALTLATRTLRHLRSDAHEARNHLESLIDRLTLYSSSSAEKTPKQN